MTELRIGRFCSAPDGVFGSMAIDGIVIFTVERPWLDNRPYVSCIPNGRYLCRPRRFYRGGYEAIEIRDVPGRSYILFHRANLPEQLAGCIAPASRLGCLHDKWAGLESGAAFQLLMESYGSTEFELEIVWTMPL